MARFRYQALSAAGDALSGELDGATVTEILAALNAQGTLPINVSPADTLSIARLRWLRSPRVSEVNLTLFTEQLSRLLKAGLPLDRALDIVAGLSDSAFRKTVNRIKDQVADGAALADALESEKGAFSKTYVSLIRAGEQGGSLPVVLARLSVYLKSSNAIRKKVISAVIYPALLVVMSLASIGIITFVVLPEFQSFLDQGYDRLPPTTRFILSAGRYARDYGWIAAIFVTLSFAGLAYGWRKPWFSGKRDAAVLRLPIIGDLIKKLGVARLARTLGTMLTNGVELSPALEIASQTVGNTVLAGALATVGRELREGESLSSALAEPRQFPELALRLLSVGEETGRLEEMLLEVSEIYDAEVETAIDRILSLLVPVLTIVMGAIIASIVGSLMMAMLSVNDLAG